MRYEPLRLDPSDLDARLDRLRWDFHKWDLYVDGRLRVAPGAIVLSQAEHRELVAVTERLARLAAKTRGALGEYDAAELGVPPAVAAFAATGGVGPAVTRIDLFRTAEGWMASELNEDVPGGYNEAIGLAAVFHDALPPGCAVAGDLPAAIRRVLAPRGAERVGLLYATAYAEDQQVIELLADLLAADGVETVAASPAAARRASGGLLLADEPVDRLYRFFPVEWFPLLPNAAIWREAIEAVPIVNPFAAAWTQSKAVFAWLHTHATGADRQTVTAHVPRTWRLGPAEAERAIRSPESFVLKPCFGRMGDGVVAGSAVPRKEWHKRVTGALREARTKPFVLQERFRPLPVPLPNGESATVCIGAYAVDGRFAGYYGRMSHRSVTQHDASNVLTVVEGL